MADVSTFFTPYAARHRDRTVEVVAIVVDGQASTASLRFVVVDQSGSASLVAAEELNLYGVHDETEALDADHAG